MDSVVLCNDTNYSLAGQFIYTNQVIYATPFFPVIPAAVQNAVSNSGNA